MSNRLKSAARYWRIYVYRPAIGLLLLTIVVSLHIQGTDGVAIGQSQPMDEMDGMDDSMGGMGMPKGPTVPPVRGYSEGREILFIHTEASDPEVASLLTEMMGGSPVLLVPALSSAPEQLLADVFVFQNGIAGMGPFGFQSDVFDHPPPSPGYRPLRSVNFVRWRDGAGARLLRSAAEVRDAEGKGELEIRRPGIVVNMPLLTWAGGTR